MKNKRVLVVDDDLAIREILSLVLKSLTDWEVLMATSGKEALVRAEQQLPDAIILDMMMPEMNGLETLKRIRANPAIQSIPVIFLTAKTLNEERPEFAELDLTGILAKPFKPLDLVQKMRSLLNWPE